MCVLASLEIYSYDVVGDKQPGKNPTTLSILLYHLVLHDNV